MKEKTLNEVLGENIRILRTVLNESQRDVSERTGIPQSVLSDLEHGRGNPTLITLKKIAKGLGTNVQTLLNDYVLTELYGQKGEDEE